MTLLPQNLQNKAMYGSNFVRNQLRLIIQRLTKYKIKRFSQCLWVEISALIGHIWPIS